MKLVDNRSKEDHKDVISQLIRKHDKCVLCTCWLDKFGLRLVLDSIGEKYLNDKFSLKLFSNGNGHTNKVAKTLLRKNKHKLNSFIADDKKKRLHTKLYYFETADNFEAIVGSANLTENGLCKNEELSVRFAGKICSIQHKQVLDYLSDLPVYLTALSC